MFPEISLHILDIVQNSISARASAIEITVSIDSTSDTLAVVIKDNGCGMSDEELSKAVDPFYTTRTKRKNGFGVPFFKAASEMTGGSFEISSKKEKGTAVKAVFVLSSIDRIPLGNMTDTLISLIDTNCRIDFIYNYSVDERSFTLDTRQLKKILGNVPIDLPEVTAFLTRYLDDNTAEVSGGKKY